jgi:hypothetical protein
MECDIHTLFLVSPEAYASELISTACTYSLGGPKPQAQKARLSSGNDLGERARR